MRGVFCAIMMGVFGAVPVGAVASDNAIVTILEGPNSCPTGFDAYYSFEAKNLPVTARLMELRKTRSDKYYYGSVRIPNVDVGPKTVKVRKGLEVSQSIIPSEPVSKESLYVNHIEISINARFCEGVLGSYLESAILTVDALVSGHSLKLNQDVAPNIVGFYGIPRLYDKQKNNGVLTFSELTFEDDKVLCDGIFVSDVGNQKHCGNLLLRFDIPNTESVLQLALVNRLFMIALAKESA